MQDIQVGTALSHGAGVTKGMLQVSYPSGWLPMEIPVTIVQGRQDRPSLRPHLAAGAKRDFRRTVLMADGSRR